MSQSSHSFKNETRHVEVEPISPRTDRGGAGSHQFANDVELDGKVATYQPVSRAAEARLTLKMDLQLLPMAFLLYWLSFLDRTNIGVAKLSGIEESLRMDPLSNDFVTATVLIYPLYCLFEIPSNWVIKRFTPGIYLPTLMVLFGLVSTMQGVVVNKQGLYAVRFFLGAVEAGVLPGLVIWLLNFYRRKEFMLRQAIYFAGASFAGAFSGLLAAAITHLNGRAGRAGWAWIFIIEGVFTIGIALIIFLIMPSTPDQLWFMTSDEKHAIRARIAADRDASRTDEPFRLKTVLPCFYDLRCVSMFIAGFAGACPIYGLAVFGPTIVKANFGTSVSATQAQLLSCPPYAVAFVFSLFLAFSSDKLQWRWLSSATSIIIAIIGFALMFALPLSQPSARYGALFIATAGTYTLPPSFLAWMPTFFYNYHRRTTSVGIVLFGVATGATAGTFFFPASQAASGFKYGLELNLAMCCTAFAAICICEGAIFHDRRNKQQGKNDYLVKELQQQGLGDDEIRARLEEKHPDFRAAL